MASFIQGPCLGSNSAMTAGAAVHRRHAVPPQQALYGSYTTLALRQGITLPLLPSTRGSVGIAAEETDR